MDSQIERILKHSELSVTGGRKKILELFLHNPGALSHGDIEKRAGEKFDRVTVYRTLQIFLEKGIIHAIPTADNSILYALCKNDCSPIGHHDNHVHFICNFCGKMICLENVSIPELNLPPEFNATQVDVVISGICKECK
jgi:Fur family ferric uptake transcriptional regulator